LTKPIAFLNATLKSNAVGSIPGIVACLYKGTACRRDFFYLHLITPMPENHLLHKVRASSDDKDEATTDTLSDLAISLALHDERAQQLHGNDAEEQIEYRKIIKRSLHQKKDEILYGALARLAVAHPTACLMLKQAIEGAAESTIVDREDSDSLEIDAFVIPVFLHTIGGLDAASCFQDQDAFEKLTASVKECELESPDAKVVIVNHGYHLNEIDGITYSHLHEMLRDAFAALTEKRVSATPAIDRSFGGWPDNPFGTGDKAIELRFLLGFSLKSTQDEFYAVPDGDSEADAYFDRRQQRFQKWTGTAAGLVKRCFGLDIENAAADNDVHFLYQDLFHGGKERGIVEYFMLQMISSLNHGLEVAGADASACKAVIGPIDLVDEIMMRVNLYAISDDKLLVSADRPVATMADWEMEIADTHDALTMIGVPLVSVARKFDGAGMPDGVKVYDGEKN
jgi:hypothetical protein